MVLSSKVNKENFRLLDLSSDDDSEDLQLEIIPSRKKKITRRDRSRTAAIKPSEPDIATEVQCALKWAVRGTLLLWLMMLTWLCASLYDQVTTMHMKIETVSTGSDSVGDALQRCHTATKELKTNTTDLSTRLARLELEYVELTKRVEKAVGDLGTVQAQLSAAPELRDIPKSLGDLQKTVGELGSQINGFDGAINSAKKQALTAATSVDEVKTLLHQLEGRTNDTIVNVTAGAKRQEELAQQVSAVNATLQASVDQLNVRIQEINKPTSTAAPTTSSTLTTTTAPPPAPTINTPPPPPPGPPAKPNVLQ